MFQGFCPRILIKKEEDSTEKGEAEQEKGAKESNCSLKLILS